MKNLIRRITSNAQAEEGHTAAWGGGGLLTIVVVVLLLIWIF